jgi:hypothetical protein
MPQCTHTQHKKIKTSNKKNWQIELHKIQKETFPYSGKNLGNGRTFLLAIHQIKD